jgi:hypothetical protein
VSVTDEYGNFIVQPEQAGVNLLNNWDFNSLARCTFAAEWSVRPYNYDQKLVLEVLMARQQTAVRFLMIREPEQSEVTFDVWEIAAPNSLLRTKDEGHLAKVLKSWIEFGWRKDSLLSRAMTWADLYLQTLEAEASLVTQGLRQAPQGLLLMHNTAKKNANSICKHGISTQYAISTPRGVWTRPPSYGPIDSTRFAGDLTMMIDASGLPIISADASAIVLGDDVTLPRIVRLFDLQGKIDG